jgi:cell wall-associated NlpC family hydrolase
MNPWAEIPGVEARDQELAYWVPFSNELPPTIIKRSHHITPVHISPKLKYPMMVALTVATIGSGSLLQAFSPSSAKAAPTGNDGTGSFQPVDETQGGEDITAAPSGGGSTYTVQQGDTLKDIAAQYGVGVSALVAANGLADPDLIYPGDNIHIPADASFAESMVTYTVQQGDTLRDIATAHGVSYTAIINYESNGISNPDVIQPGQELTIPGGSAPVAVGAADTSFAETEPTVSYTVQLGDTLRAIASAHGVSYEAIVNYGANGISNPDALSVGQELAIPGGSAPVDAGAADTSFVEAEPTVGYTVQQGDTLRAIASAHGVSYEAIVNYEPNGISNPDALSVGQELAIPGGTAPVASVSAPQEREPEPVIESAPEPEPEPAPEPQPEPEPEPQPEPEPEPVVEAAPEPEQPAQAAPSSGGTGQAIVNLAMQFQGAPYVWGATGPSSFDCTGFTYYVVNQITGGGFPRDMHGQASFGTPVSSDNLQPGDIVFQQNTYKAGLSHAGIYIGGGQFINAANPGSGVVISNLWDSYWGPRYHSAVRFD